MSGMGADAEIMASTSSELKKVVGSAAYFLAAAQKVGTTPYDLTITSTTRSRCSGAPCSRSSAT